MWRCAAIGLFVRRWKVVGRLGFGNIDPFGRVNNDFVDAVVPEQPDFVFSSDEPLVPQEGGLEPRNIQPGDVHAWFESIDGNASFHGASEGSVIIRAAKAIARWYWNTWNRG